MCIPDQGVKVIQVDDAEGHICPAVPAKSILPPWVRHG
jgi:hypothetical protein